MEDFIVEKEAYSLGKKFNDRDLLGPCLRQAFIDLGQSAVEDEAEAEGGKSQVIDEKVFH